MVKTAALSRGRTLSPPALSAGRLEVTQPGRMQQCFPKLLSSQCSLLDSEMTATVHFGLEKVILGVLLSSDEALEVF